MMNGKLRIIGTDEPEKLIAFLEEARKSMGQRA